jgi:hypothetical protein
LRPPGATYGCANSPCAELSILPAYSSASVCRPTAAGRASVSVVSCAALRVCTRATGTPSSRAARIVRLSVLNAMRAVGRRTSSTTVSLPVSVFAAASGVTAIR